LNSDSQTFLTRVTLKHFSALGDLLRDIRMPPQRIRHRILRSGHSILAKSIVDGHLRESVHTEPTTSIMD